MVAGDFAKIRLCLDASAADSMLLQKLARALRFDILISFLYRHSFLWYKFQEDSLLLYLALLKLFCTLFEGSTGLYSTMAVCALL